MKDPGVESDDQLFSEAMKERQVVHADEVGQLSDEEVEKLCAGIQADEDAQAEAEAVASVPTGGTSKSDQFVTFLTESEIDLCREMSVPLFAMTKEVWALQFLSWCCGRIGGGFHCETSFCEYVDVEFGLRTFTREKALVLEKCMARVREILDDPCAMVMFMLGD